MVVSVTNFNLDPKFHLAISHYLHSTLAIVCYCPLDPRRSSQCALPMLDGCFREGKHCNLVTLPTVQCSTAHSEDAKSQKQAIINASATVAAAAIAAAATIATAVAAASIEAAAAAATMSAQLKPEVRMLVATATAAAVAAAVEIVAA